MEIAIAGAARDELAICGARPRRELMFGRESLTAAEQRVAQMAADGLTNRAIAQALFVTEKTVELHLTHVYQKLGVRSRRQLPTALGGPPNPVSSSRPSPKRGRRAHDPGRILEKGASTLDRN